MEEVKKYYWLKLKRDFFKRHDVNIIENMPNGKDYVLFYLKLLVESVDHDGELRFSDTIPYDENMLATITNTNIDIVRSAMNVLVNKLQLIEILSDQTIYMTEIEKMVGGETYWAEKKRITRAKQPLLPQEVDNVQTMSLPCPICPTKSKSKIKSKSIDIYTDNSANAHRFIPPNIEDVQAYCKERNNQVNAQSFIDHYTANGWMRGKTKIKDWKACVRTWEQTSNTKEPAGRFDKLKKNAAYFAAKEASNDRNGN